MRAGVRQHAHSFNLMASLHPDLALYANVDGTLIFLNVHANRFFALTRAREDAFRTSAGEALANRGACVISRGQVPRICLADDIAGLSAISIATVQAASRTSEPTGSHRLFVEAMYDRLLMRRLVRRGNLKKIHEILRSARDAGHIERDPEAVFRIANGAIRVVSSFVNAESDCLALASARAKFIIRRGIPVNCVLGVRLNPFSAHAWVQYEDLVVGEDADFVRIHTPIAAL